jgi:hypothetical protein
MRAIVLVLTTVATALAINARTAAAQDYPWCALYSFGATNCGFNTFQQCLDTVRGVSGNCYPNPRYQATTQQPRPRRSRS